MNNIRGRLECFFWPTQKLDKAGLVEAIEQSADWDDLKILRLAPTAITSRRRLEERVTHLRELAAQTRMDEISVNDAASLWRVIHPSKRPLEIQETNQMNDLSRTVIMDNARGRSGRFFFPAEELDKAGLVEAIELSADRHERQLFHLEPTAITSRRRLGERIIKIRELAAQTRKDEISVADAAAGWRVLVPSKRPIIILENG